MKEVSSILCPKCGAPLREAPRSYSCSKWKEGCTFTIWKESFSHAVTPDEAASLVEGEELGPFKLKSKEGREYTASLYYSKDEGRVKLRFPPREEQ